MGARPAFLLEREIGLEMDGVDHVTVFKVANSLNYDIILGINLLQQLKFQIDFQKRT